jgi:DNA polymerase-3 subunit delta'
MAKLALHPDTELQLAQFTKRPSHALLIVGTSGIGKGSIARLLTSNLVQKPIETIHEQPYVRIVASDEKTRSISIEAVRQLEHFLALKVPGDEQRIIVIEDAHGMTIEAQNALLKTLEEPAAGTTIILTASSEQSMLPTIRSRTTLLTIKKPPAEELATYFNVQGHVATAIRQAQLMSGGLPGLMHALLEDDTAHPLAQAVVTAREIIQKTPFERLVLVDKLSKDREHTLNTLAMLQQMAQVSLVSGTNSKTWQHILRQSYAAADLLAGSAQPKLVLTNLMLSL